MIKITEQFIKDFEELKRQGLNDEETCKMLGYSTTWMYKEFRRIGYVRPNFQRERDEKLLKQYIKLLATGMQKQDIAFELGTTEQTMYDTLKRLGYSVSQEETDKQEARLALYWDLKSKNVQDIHMWRYFGFKHQGSWHNWRKMMRRRGYDI